MGWKYLRTSWKLESTLVYRMGIQIYDQISIPKKWSEVNLHCEFSLELGLKGIQISRNIAKVGVHACISNMHPNLWLISIPRIWSKVQLHHAISLWFGLKEGKIALTIMKFSMHCYLGNGHQNLWSYINSDKLVKSETSLWDFAKVGLKGGENNSKCPEISCAYFCIKWTSKSMIKFKFQVFGQKSNSIMRFH